MIRKPLQKKGFADLRNLTIPIRDCQPPSRVVQFTNIIKTLIGGFVMNLEKYRYDGGGKFDIRSYDTFDKGDSPTKEEAAALLSKNRQLMGQLQDKLFAEGKTGVLVLFQAMDAAGKDSTVKHVFSGINPQGVKVYSFKRPSDEELNHDYLWRAQKVLPARGIISIFNRSYYEDVLVAKVHKLYREYCLPDRCKRDEVIDERYRQIRNFEEYLWENAIIVIKFFLHISKDEQRKRLLKRIDDEAKNWKFEKNDLKEREYWDDYQHAYEKAIQETSTKKNPWFVIPSDRKWYARTVISEIIMKQLKEIDPQYPELSAEAKADLENCRKSLMI
jgi:PPK2 family polyphosphate:nucleotide phosphotransferase